MEVWKDIKGYEGLYQISNFGRIKSLDRLIDRGCKGIRFQKERFSAPQINTAGYWQVMLCKNGFKKTYSVHRFLALAFIPNPDNKAEVNHKNGIKTDNRLKNLEWCTPSENMIHAFKNGFLKSQGGSLNNNAKLNEAQVKKIRSLYSTGNHKQKEIASKYNMSTTQINHIIHYKRWKNEN